jgi:hypothetical protein
MSCREVCSSGPGDSVCPKRTVSLYATLACGERVADQARRIAMVAVSIRVPEQSKRIGAPLLRRQLTPPSAFNRQISRHIVGGFLDRLGSDRRRLRRAAGHEPRHGRLSGLRRR